MYWKRSSKSSFVGYRQKCHQRSGSDSTIICRSLVNLIGSSLVHIHSIPINDIRNIRKNTHPASWGGSLYHPRGRIWQFCAARVFMALVSQFGLKSNFIFYNAFSRKEYTNKQTLTPTNLKKFLEVPLLVRHSLCKTSKPHIKMQVYASNMI
jgi:hypothetical protein